MKYLIAMVLTVFAINAFAAHDLVCTLKKVSGKTNSFTFDNKITVRVDPNATNDITVKGQNIGVCSANVFNNTNDLLTARADYSKKCNITTFVASWTNDLGAMNTKAELRMTSYDMYVMYGQGIYSCETIRLDRI